MYQALGKQWRMVRAAWRTWTALLRQVRFKSTTQKYYTNSVISETTTQMLPSCKMVD